MALQAVARLEATLSASGLDVLHPLALSWYNAAAAPVGAAIPAAPGGAADPLTLLVGNSRALWEPFLVALAAEPALRASPHPLLAYVEAAVEAALGAAGAALAPRRVFWSHRAYGGGELPGGAHHVAMQRMAAAAGAAFFDGGASRLCLHPVHGPWWALRAAVVVDGAAWGGAPRPRPLPCPLGAAARAAVARAVEAASGGGGGAPSEADVRERWRLWVAVRDAAGGGGAHPSRYSDEQVCYHYTADRAVLRDALRRRGESLEGWG